MEANEAYSITSTANPLTITTVCDTSCNIYFYFKSFSSEIPLVGLIPATALNICSVVSKVKGADGMINEILERTSLIGSVFQKEAFYKGVVNLGPLGNQFVITFKNDANQLVTFSSKYKLEFELSRVDPTWK